MEEELLDATVIDNQAMSERGQQVTVVEEGKSGKKSFAEMFRNVLQLPDYDMYQRDFLLEVGEITPSPKATPNPNAITHRLE